MIILPTSTPAILADVNNNNQTQHQQMQNAEQSKKASDTVQISAQAREMAGSGLNNNRPPATNDPVAVIKAADNEAAEAVADNENTEAARPANPVTGIPDNNRINLIG